MGFFLTIYRKFYVKLGFTGESKLRVIRFPFDLQELQPQIHSMEHGLRFDTYLPFDAGEHGHHFTLRAQSAELQHVSQFEFGLRNFGQQLFVHRTDIRCRRGIGWRCECVPGASAEANLRYLGCKRKGRVRFKTADYQRSRIRNRQRSSKIGRDRCFVIV